MTASLKDDAIIFTATVPKGTWFGLGFGHNGTKVMNGTDIILFDATWNIDEKDPTKSTYGTAKDVYAADSGKQPGDPTDKVTTDVVAPKDSTKQSTIFQVTRPLDPKKT